MKVRLAIDGATYEYHDLDSNQFDAIVKLLESMSDCTLYPTGKLALGDEFLMTSGKTYQRMLEHKLTEKDNEIARRIEAFTRAVNANGEMTRKIADLIGDVALAKAENSGLRSELKAQRQEIDRLIDQPAPVTIRQQAERIKDLNIDNERLDREITRLSSSRDEIYRENKRLGGTIVEQKQQLADLLKTIAYRDQDLDAQCKEIYRPIAELDAARASKPPQAPSLEARIDEQDAEIGRLRDELGRRHQQIVTQSAKIDLLLAIINRVGIESP
jgi:chromosome segregation ATPase